MRREELITQLRHALHLLKKPNDGDPIEFDIMDTTFEAVFPDTPEGKEVCPFCSGSKIKPFMGAVSQDCKECDKDGFIGKAKLRRYGLES